jgi:hypothetical protein
MIQLHQNIHRSFLLSSFQSSTNIHVSGIT